MKYACGLAMILAASPVVATAQVPSCTDADIPFIQYPSFDSLHIVPEGSFLREVAASPAAARIDIDNDGVPDYVVQVSYLSGAGQGCDKRWLTTLNDARDAISESATSKTLAAMASQCGDELRAFTFKGRAYIEKHHRGEAAVNYTMDGAAIRQVCTFGARQSGTQFRPQRTAVPLGAYPYAGQAGRHFEARDYVSAERAVGEQARSQAGTPGRGGIDARFGLREFALAVVEREDSPAPARLKILQAAMGSLVNSRQTTRNDIEADLTVAIRASMAFEKQSDPTHAIAALELALAVDQRHAEGERSFPQVALGYTGPIQAAMHAGGMTGLVAFTETVASEPSYGNIRRRLISELYECREFWRDADSPATIGANADAVVKMTDLLQDAIEYKDERLVAQWRWRPLLFTGIAYARIGKATEARSAITASVEMIHHIDDPDQRLRELDRALDELIAERYDIAVARTVAEDVLQLATTLDTPRASEVKVGADRRLKRLESANGLRN